MELTSEMFENHLGSKIVGDYDTIEEFLYSDD